MQPYHNGDIVVRNNLDHKERSNVIGFVVNARQANPPLGNETFEGPWVYYAFFPSSGVVGPLLSFELTRP